MPPIIQIEGISKKYEILRQSGPRQDWIATDALRLLRRAGRRVIGRGPATVAPKYEEVWALADVSFDVAHGEILGLVGHNGAGKSTLLKVRSRITEPTEGRITLRGQLNSLLEVGIGFHPELTGRENLYLKGAIHGLTREAINRKFDDIIAFAGIARYLDTPMKRYSSGMRSRLGFAIGAYLQHDILVVDEVLAVGDAQFRTEALSRIKQAAYEDGTTTIFVSHDLDQIRDLCPRSVLLSEGRVVADGETQAVLQQYLEPTESAALPASWACEDEDRGRITRVAMTAGDGAPCSAFRVGGPMGVEVTARELATFHGLDAHLWVESIHGHKLFRFRASMVGVDITAGGADALRLQATIAALPLTPGQYWLGVMLVKAGGGRGGRIARKERVLRFVVLPSDPYNAGDAFVPADGPIWVQGTWKSEALIPSEDASEAQVQAGAGRSEPAA